MAVATDEHVLIYEPDHEGRAVELMLWQDRERPRLQALVRALAHGAQHLEDVIWAVIVGSTTIQGAEGANLDRWGRIVGEERGGLDEATYRRFIGLRIRVNTLFQSEDATYELLRDALYPFTVRRYLLADGIVWVVDTDDWLDASIAAHVGALLRDFRPIAIYEALVEQVPDVEFRIGTTSGDGSAFGSIASPGPLAFGRLIFAGRGR